jgi:hypothetical protein
VVAAFLPRLTPAIGPRKKIFHFLPPSPKIAAAATKFLMDGRSSAAVQRYFFLFSQTWDSRPAFLVCPVAAAVGGVPVE